MKALELNNIGHLDVNEARALPEMSETDVLVKVKAVGVCGSDYERVFNSGAHKMPIVLGHELSGVVEGTGQKVEKIQKGDRVVVVPLIPCHQCEWCHQGEFSICDDYDYIGSRRDGGMAEYVLVPQENILLLPKKVSYISGAMVEPAANAIHALWIGQMKASDSLCVTGAGPIGQMAIQYARVLGIKKIISVDIVPDKLELAKRMGATHIIDTTQEDFIEAIKEITEGRGVDLLLEASGAPSIQAVCPEIVAKLGRIVLLGFSHKDVSFPAHVYEMILRKQIKLMGSWNTYSENFPGEEWRYTLKLMERSELDVLPLISHMLSLEEAPAFFEAVKNKSIDYNKVMIINN
ncbi:galactitol-1-phosphate 5-dehydrogenase [Eubacterium barkeri]|nr:galactitol-1-phosphate 5-dehydrogenase [Eubacterium barkeri]